MKAKKAKIYRTDKNGNVVFTSTVSKITVKVTKKSFISADLRGIIKLPMNLSEENLSSTNVVVLAVENPFTTDNRRPYISNKISLVD
ncbi:hypothetical protein [Viridibacillus arvi]|uniref:hypothetical protein n=1 Tax=Viridibacillus arvi TaxID=263475 RepID=UPI003D295BB7